MNEPPVSATGIPDGITRDDVLRAIADLDRGDVAHGFRDSTGYDLLYDGKRYPPKAVVGLAARRLRGPVLDPNEFTGGADPRCFSLLRLLGFEVVPKKDIDQPVLPEEPTQRVWLETTKSDHKLYFPRSS
jgi:hypothetical protein